MNAKSYCVDMIVTIEEGEAKKAGYRDDKEYTRETIFDAGLPFHEISLDRLFGEDIQEA